MIRRGRVEDGWWRLDLAAPARDRVRRPGDEPALLRRSSQLRGSRKLALDENGGLRLRAELPAELHAVPDGATLADDAAALAQRTSWPSEERADGALVFDLGMTGDYVPAILTREHGDLELSVDLASASDPACRRAIAVLGLRINGAFRWVRATLDPAGAVQLGISLPGCVRGSKLDRALAALATASRASVREARAVATDARIAAALLADDSSTTNSSEEEEVQV